MIKKFCAAANKILIKIMLGLIIVSLVLNETRYYLINRYNNYAAKINGQQISNFQLEQALQHARNLQQTSIDIDSKQAAEQHLRQQVLSQLIDEKLLEQYAVDKLELAIGDNQIKQVIFTIPTFITANKFDNNKFRSFIKKQGLTPYQYAVLIGNQLITQQLIQSIESTSFLLPEEINRLLALVVQTREARLATVNLAAIAANQSISQEEILDSYQDHKNKYLSPELFHISYILMDANKIEAHTTINDKHHNYFFVPSCQHYSIIQSKKQNEADTWLEQLRQGADFAALAKATSTNVISANNCVDIGWISDSYAMKKIKQAKNLTKPVFFITRLNNIQPGRLSKLSTVHNEVVEKDKVQQKQTIHAVYSALQYHFRISDQNTASYDREMLASAPIKAGIKLKQTGWFSRDHVPVDLNYDTVKQVLFDGLTFSRKIERNPAIITVDGKRAFIICITDHQPETVLPLAEVSSQVEQEVKRQKALEQAKVDASKLLVALNKPVTVDKILNNNHIKKYAGIRFSEKQSFDSLDQDSSLLAQAVFMLYKPLQGKSRYGIANDAHGNLVLIALDSVMQRPLNNQQQKLFLAQLNQNMVNQHLDALLVNLRRSGKIKIGKIV